MVSVTLLPATASVVASGSWDATRSSGIFASGARSIFILKSLSNTLASSSVYPTTLGTLTLTPVGALAK